MFEVGNSRLRMAEWIIDAASSRRGAAVKRCKVNKGRSDSSRSPLRGNIRSVCSVSPHLTTERARRNSRPFLSAVACEAQRPARTEIWIALKLFQRHGAKAVTVAVGFRMARGKTP